MKRTQSKPATIDVDPAAYSLASTFICQASSMAFPTDAERLSYAVRETWAALRAYSPGYARSTVRAYVRRLRDQIRARWGMTA